MADQTSLPWAQTGSYPRRPHNEIQILIDGQAAYQEIYNAFKKAKRFIYMTISYGAQDFLLVPESNETLFNILRSRSRTAWTSAWWCGSPRPNTDDTIPDQKIAGVNEGPGSIQARWDKAKGYSDWYRSPHGHFEPFYLDFPAELGCHHQKTYIMDDGERRCRGLRRRHQSGSVLLGYSGTRLIGCPTCEARESDPLKGLEKTPPLHDIFYRIRGTRSGRRARNFVERYNGASIPHKDVTLGCGTSGHRRTNSTGAQRHRGSGSEDDSPGRLTQRYRMERGESGSST